MVVGPTTPPGSKAHHLENSLSSAQHAPSLLSTYHLTGNLSGKTLSMWICLLVFGFLKFCLFQIPLLPEVWHRCLLSIQEEADLEL